MNRRQLFNSILGSAATLQTGSAQLRGLKNAQSESKKTAARHCYTEEWKRTKPDYVLYLPPEPLGDDGDNEHVHVVRTPTGDLLATWSQGSYEASRDSRTVAARSRDGGLSWSSPQMIAGPTDHPGFTAVWAVPIVGRSGRIYLLFDKHTGVSDFSYSVTGLLRCIYSDDDG